MNASATQNDFDNLKIENEKLQAEKSKMMKNFKESSEKFKIQQDQYEKEIQILRDNLKAVLLFHIAYI